MQVQIREISREDIPEVASLEADIFSDPWTISGVEESFDQKQARIAGAYCDGKLYGYLIIYYVLDEAEIARVAVAKEKRRSGLASGLMEWLLAFCEDQEITRILLDVRESNQSARTFYEKWGFQTDGIRKRFYTDPVESAILMSRER